MHSLFLYMTAWPKIMSTQFGVFHCVSHK